MMHEEGERSRDSSIVPDAVTSAPLYQKRGASQRHGTTKSHRITKRRHTLSQHKVSEKEMQLVNTEDGQQLCLLAAVPTGQVAVDAGTSTPHSLRRIVLLRNVTN